MEIRETNTTKGIVRVLIVTALVLMVPLVAMQFSDEVQWDASDFMIIGILLIGTGLIYELGVRKIANSAHRTIFGVVLLVALFLMWAELAVGIFGTPFGGS
jgi:hypothetical protein